MKEIRKAVRDLQTGLRKAGREADGHTVSDDIGNAGDEARKRAANARDDARSGARQVHSRAHEEESRARDESRDRGR